MLKTRRRMEFFAFYDDQGIARHLERMSQKGWMIERINNYFWTYRRIEPQRLRFAVTYFPEASDFNPGPTENQQTFQEYCESAGWRFAVQWCQMQIFYSENPAAVPLETDEFSRLQNIHRCMRKNFLPGNIVILILMGILMGLQLLSVPRDLLSLLAENARLITVTMLLLAILSEAGMLLGYYFWRRRSLRSVANGGSCARGGRFQHRLGGPVWLLVLLLLALYLCSVGAYWPVILICAAMFSGITAITLAARAIMRKKGFAKETNIAATAVLILFLSIGFGVGLPSLSDWMRDSGLFEKQPAYIYTTQTGSSSWDWEVYADPIPLKVQDLRATDYPHYSYELTERSSPLVSVMKASQTGFPDGLENERLLYTVVRLKQEVWFRPVLESMLKADERFRYDGEQDSFLLVDAPQWGADEVYQRHIDGEPQPEYYVCYAPACILQLDLSWEPTAQEITVIREKLGV